MAPGIAELIEHPEASWQHRMCKINIFKQAFGRVHNLWC
jgi:hypothetical protein